MLGQDLTPQLQQRVTEAIAANKPLNIVGGGSKDFYGGRCTAEQHLDMCGHYGVVDYEPSELVITARAGSRLQDIAALLASRRQMLGFEPPLFDAKATLGGSVACGFSGPRRPFAGSARDFVLGCKIINGHGQILNFGGRVMKNVAGFDVSRLMVGALGTLGLLLELSLRVLPMPEAEATLVFELAAEQALRKMNELCTQPWPLSALAFEDGLLWLRLSGARAAVAEAAQRLGGDVDPAGEDYWLDLRGQQLPFFQQPGALWRITLPPAAPQPELAGRWLIEWGGGLRWLLTDAEPAAIHAAAERVGGHACCYRGSDKTGWMRLAPGMLALQQRVRSAFDPLHLFNPGRLLP